MRKQLLAATIATLALAATGSALAGPRASSVQIAVTLMDGKIVAAPTSFTAGPVTLVVVNRGKRRHALAISGVGVGAKRTATLKAGATAKLSLTAHTGPYKLWDPITGSLSKATVLTARASGTSSVTNAAASGSLSNNGTTTCQAGQNSDMPDPSALGACPTG